MRSFRLKLAWLNEKMAPEILENDDDITENALTMIETMEANLKQNTRNDQTSTIKHSIHSMDVDRVRYVLTSYVRHGYSSCFNGQFQEHVTHVPCKKPTS